MCSGGQHRPGSWKLVLFWTIPITPWKGSELRNLTRRCFFCHAASPGKPAFLCTCNFSRHSAASLWGALPWDPMCTGWGSCTVSGSPELRRCSSWWHPAQRVSLPATAAAPCRQGLRHLPAQVCYTVYMVLSSPMPHPTPAALPQNVSEKQRHRILGCRKRRPATPPSLRVPICCPARANYNCFIWPLLGSILCLKDQQSPSNCKNRIRCNNILHKLWLIINPTLLKS